MAKIRHKTKTKKAGAASKEPNTAKKRAVRHLELKVLRSQHAPVTKTGEALPPVVKQEAHMPFLFWATIPFAMMDIWFGSAEEKHALSK